MLGYHHHVGPVHMHVDAAELAVVDRLVAQVAQRVLVARLVGNLGVALLNAVHAAFRIQIAARSTRVLVQNVVVHREGQMEAAEQPSPQRAESPTSVP